MNENTEVKKRAPLGYIRDVETKAIIPIFVKGAIEEIEKSNQTQIKAGLKHLIKFEKISAPKSNK